MTRHQHPTTARRLDADRRVDARRRRTATISPAALRREHVRNLAWFSI